MTDKNKNAIIVIVYDKREVILLHIREIRTGCGMTQQQLAEKLGVGRSAIANWEVERSLPNADKLPYLADALGCTIDELYGRGRDGA